MPYKVGRSDQCPPSKPFACMKQADGKLMGCHATEADAKAQMAALYAAEPAASKGASTSLNSAGVANANAKIGSGSVDKTSGWSFSGDDGNAMLGSKGDNWGEYAKWFLAIHPDAPEKTKNHYGYPFGKGGKVYRSGVIAVKQRAAAQGDSAIYNAADALLDKIDGVAEKPNEADEADSGKGVVIYADNKHLHGPLALALGPNGNLFTANGDAINPDPANPSELTEFTPQGRFVAQLSVDPATGGAFGIAFSQVHHDMVQFGAVDDNASPNNITVWTLPFDSDER